MEIRVNKYQTLLTDELLSSLPEETKEDLFSYINNVEFIKNLISPDREYAKDRPRDKYGRIIVDLCNPHILEDMDYFRPTALHYQKYGVLTDLAPNGNPKSEFGRWIGEEIRRCWEGYVRPEDGEWIPGDMYFYLNYTPIIQSVIDPETGASDRVVDFPKVWEGVYMRAHYHYQARFGGLYNDYRVGQHAFEIAKRGMSKSYYCAAMLAKCFILGVSRLSHKNTRGIVYATDKEKLIKDGILNKFVSIIDFCAENTQFPTQRIVDSLDKMTWTMGYKDLDTLSNRGTGNTVLGVPIGDKEGKGRGKRCNIQIYEEIGEFSNFLETYGTNRRSVEEGGHSFGISIGVGTGGSKHANFAGCQELIYNPIGYNVYGLPNVFDKNTAGGKKCILFLGAYLNRSGCYNENGVSDVTKALLEILEERRKVKYNSSRADTLDRVIAEDPITIQEAILRKEGSRYPVTSLSEHLLKMDTTPGFFDTVYVGNLVQDESGEIKPVTGDYTSIRDFPHKDNKQPGAIEIYEMPVRDQNDKVMYGRYVAGLDTFDDDSSDTLSLGSIQVLDLFTDRIVAEYTGRKEFADEFYETCRLLLLFYNGVAMYENNKKGLFAYFSRMNCTHLLADVPDFLKEKDPQKEYLGNKAKGVHATEPVKKYYRQLIREWLISPIETIIGTENGKEETLTQLRLTTLRSRALVKELIMWDPNNNYDRHDAFGMLMLIRTDRVRLAHGDIEHNRTQKDPSNRDGDKFFANYDKKKEKKKSFSWARNK